MTRDISKSDVEQAMSEIDVLVSRIGDDKQQEFTGQHDDGSAVIGRQVVHGGHTYRVIGKAGEPCLQMEMKFDAAESLAIQRAQADGGAASGAVRQQPQQLSPTAVQQAANDIRDELTDDEVAEIRSELFDRLATGAIGASTNTAGDLLITGFELNSKLFVYDDSLSPSEFHDQVQTMVNTFWSSREFLVERYGLRDFDGSDGIDSQTAFH